MNPKHLSSADSFECTTDTIITAENIQKPGGNFEARKYKLGKLIARGSLSNVYEVTDLTTNKKMAAKIIRKSVVEQKGSKNNLINAISLHKSLQHPHIVSINQTFEDAKRIYIIMELCTNQTLYELLVRKGKLTEQEARKFLLQLMEALRCVHNHKIIHRDIKLEHLFLDEKMRLKLGGFGYSMKLKSGNERRSTVSGSTDAYLSEATCQTDIRAVGLVMYHLIVGIAYGCPNRFYKFHDENTVVIPSDVSISPLAKDLLSVLLIPKNCKKATLDQIPQHPFFKCSEESSFSQSPSFSALSMCGKDTCDISSIPCVQTSNITFKDFNSPTSSYNDSVSASTSCTNSSQKDHSVRPRCYTEGKIGFSLSMERKTEKSALTEVADLGVCVAKWLDYSSKYGMGYTLSDGSTGVIFQDGSSIISELRSQTFEYIEARSNEEKEQIITCSFKNCPEKLEKKVKLYRLFKEHLEENHSSVSNIKHLEKEITSSKIINSLSNRSNCFVRRWMKTGQAIFFKMNNKLVQTVFKDGTVLVMSPLNKGIVYICEEGKRYSYKEDDIRMAKGDTQQKILYVQAKLKEQSKIFRTGKV